MFGEAFGVEAWARDLFAEEVVRGGPAFAVSLLITSIEAHLRNAAALGSWQVISPQQATGVVVEVEGLSEVQDKTYDVPTVLLAHQVKWWYDGRTAALRYHKVVQHVVKVQFVVKRSCAPSQLSCEASHHSIIV